jgi:uncharacterized protein
MFKSFIIFSLALVSLTSCIKKPSEKSFAEDDSFNKQEMLTNISDQVIIPAYNDFKDKLTQLSSNFNSFKTSGSSADFTLVKNSFRNAYTSYQYISTFEFGPAENVAVRSHFNVFPTDTIQIKSNFLNGGYNLSTLTNLDAKGFPALDFLFYSPRKTENEIINSFNDIRLKNYVDDLLKDMSTRITSVINGWNEGYRNSFTKSLGTDVGSSLGFLINQINYDFEIIKNAKIGIPLGKKSMGALLPEHVEAFYCGESLFFIKEHLDAIENIYLGRSLTGADGKGFDDYLEHLNIQHNGTTLNSAIKNQFENVRSKLKILQNPFSTQIATNGSQVEAAYTEILKLLVLLKTDLPSNLGVVITYQDGDGD